MSPRLALTPGEPAGIGPDLTVAIAQRARDYPLIAIADPDLLAQRAALLGLPLEIECLGSASAEATLTAGRLSVLPVRCPQPVQPGQLDPANARYVLDTLTLATDLCQAGQLQALVTGPVHKGIINEAGQPFSGHTEFLAERTGCDEVVMMLATPGLRVALVTTHLLLRAVPDAITDAKLSRVLEILHADLQHKFGIAKPRILVLGLNPHAGEGGHLGREEIEIISPVLERYRAQGWQLTGPLPADTAFTPRLLDHADAVLAMYHDQGLPVLKYRGFGNAVNITLGLPIIRTSVDHGTALELAGTGRADTGSLLHAIDCARAMVLSHT